MATKLSSQSSPVSSKVGGCFLIGLALFWSAIVVGIDTWLLTNAVRQAKATQFATVPGKIITSEVTTSRGRKGRTSYNVRIHYQYAVEGTTYTGTRLRYGTTGGSDRRWADAAVAEFPAGAERTVYYDPQAPGEALLRPGIQGSDLLFAMFLTPFNLIMAVLWWGAVALIKKPREASAGAGVTLLQEPGRFRARLSDWSAGATALVVVGGGAFVAVLIVAFATGVDPSLGTMLAVWAGLIATGGGVGAWQASRQQSGHYDLVIDLGARTVSLPATEGRKARRLLGWNQIQSVEKRVILGRKRSQSYQIILHTQGDGQAEEIVLVTHDQAKAEAFEGWLRERLGV